MTQKLFIKFQCHLSIGYGEEHCKVFLTCMNSIAILLIWISADVTTSIYELVPIDLAILEMIENVDGHIDDGACLF